MRKLQILLQEIILELKNLSFQWNKPEYEDTIGAIPVSKVEWYHLKKAASVLSVNDDDIKGWGWSERNINPDLYYSPPGRFFTDRHYYWNRDEGAGGWTSRDKMRIFPYESIYWRRENESHLADPYRVGRNAEDINYGW